jgi:hypothetical protein
VITCSYKQYYPLVPFLISKVGCNALPRCTEWRFKQRIIPAAAPPFTRLWIIRSQKAVRRHRWVLPMPLLMGRSLAGAKVQCGSALHLTLLTFWIAAPAFRRLAMTGLVLGKSKSTRSGNTNDAIYGQQGRVQCSSALHRMAVQTAE